MGDLVFNGGAYQSLSLSSIRRVTKPWNAYNVSIQASTECGLGTSNSQYATSRSTTLNPLSSKCGTGVGHSKMSQSTIARCMTLLYPW